MNQIDNIEELIAAAITIAAEKFRRKEFVKWAENWLSAKNRDSDDAWSVADHCSRQTLYESYCSDYSGMRTLVAGYAATAAGLFADGEIDEARRLAFRALDRAKYI